MTRFMYGTHVLLHTSVFLFFWAISDFFYTVDHHFGTVAHYILAASVIGYMMLSISPLIFSNSPYNTPATPLLRAACIILRIIIRFPSGCLRRIRGQSFKLIGLEYYKGIHFDKVLFFSIEAEKRRRRSSPTPWNGSSRRMTSATAIWTSFWRVFRDTSTPLTPKGSIGRVSNHQLHVTAYQGALHNLCNDGRAF
ncbi:hypothetical protein BGY98DRAFT_382581 [Russula aff. rugulosa BPL654]|nr:hypothetical protein BGY98DRAFT_382581 [Russula aff. rugulosa BPL654]